MKQFRLLTLLALLLTAATGAWAEEQVVYTLGGTQTASNTAYGTAGVVNQGGITWMVTGNVNQNPWRIGGKSLSGVDRPVLSENSLNETVTKVTLDFGEANSITVNSITMTVAGDADFNNVIDTKAVTFSANNTVDVTPTEGKEWKNAYYRFVFNVTVSGGTNKYFQLKSIKFYNDPDAQQQGGSTEPVAGTFTAALAEGTEDAEKWQVKVGEKAAAFPVEGLNGGETVTVTYNGSKKVKSVKAVKKGAAPAPASGTDLATITADYEAKDGETLTGTLASNVKISIADGATVTLKDVNITNLDINCNWAGISCLGDATLVLEGTNTVCAGRDGSGYNNYPGIWIASGKTLTVQGDGTLTAYSNVSQPYAAGIGGGYNIACGNIVINSGTITATGGYGAAGIGSGQGAGCGNITINGGTVTATGGQYGAGIGSGGEGENYGSCGNITISGGTVEATGGENAAGIGGGRYNGACGTITITSGVTSVKATKGEGAESIGKGNEGQDITVNIENGANVTQN